MTQNECEQASRVRKSYTTDQDHSLTEAVLDAIEECKGEDLQRTDFVLYEDVNPDALDSLFRHDAQPRTVVSFDTDGVKLELWGDDGIEIRVTDQSVE